MRHHLGRNKQRGGSRQSTTPSDQKGIGLSVEKGVGQGLGGWSPSGLARRVLQGRPSPTTMASRSVYLGFSPSPSGHQWAEYQSSPEVLEQRSDVGGVGTLQKVRAKSKRGVKCALLSPRFSPGVSGFLEVSIPVDLNLGPGSSTTIESPLPSLPLVLGRTGGSRSPFRLNRGPLLSGRHKCRTLPPRVLRRPRVSRTDWVGPQFLPKDLLPCRVDYGSPTHPQ